MDIDIETIDIGGEAHVRYVAMQWYLIGGSAAAKFINACWDRGDYDTQTWSVSEVKMHCERLGFTSAQTEEVIKAWSELI